MGVYEAAKDALMLAQNLKNVEMIGKLMEIQKQALDTQDENRELREKIRSLEDSIAQAKAMTFREPFYFAPNDTVPYCSSCWDVKRQAVHLKATRAMGSGAALVGSNRWDCPACRNIYYSKP